MELKGLKFNKNNGRIYSPDLFKFFFNDLEIRLRSKTRRDKIKNIFNDR